MTTISQNIAQKLDIVPDATRNPPATSSAGLRFSAESGFRTGFGPTFTQLSVQASECVWPVRGDG